MAVVRAAPDGARRYLARPDIFHLHGVTSAMAVEILAAHIPAPDGAAALAHVHAEHAALYAATAPVAEPHPARPRGSELTAAAVRSLDPAPGQAGRGLSARVCGNRRSGLRCCRGNGHRPACLTGGRRPACPGAGLLGGRERIIAACRRRPGRSAAGPQSVTAFGREVRRSAPVVRAAEARNPGASDDY